jgi:hypothetical protein
VKIFRVGKKPGKFEKKPWEWENMVFTGENGRNCLFFQNTSLKSMLNRWKINDGMF